MVRLLGAVAEALPLHITTLGSTAGRIDGRRMIIALGFSARIPPMLWAVLLLTPEPVSARSHWSTRISTRLKPARVLALTWV